jgi:phospholipase C
MRAADTRTLPLPKPPASAEPHPRQEPGQRPARALPYALEVASRAGPQGLALSVANAGEAGAALSLYPAGPGEPRFYAVEAGKQVEDLVQLSDGAYDLALHGPNGFLRIFKGQAASAGPDAAARFSPREGRLYLELRNDGPKPVTLELAPVAYRSSPPRLHRLGPGERGTETYDLTGEQNWYDILVTCAEAPSFQRRFAGHGEDGKPSVSDPLLGRQA